MAIAIGDLNGDGKLDIVTANSDSNDVTILLNTTARALSPAAEVDSGLRLSRSGSAAVIRWNFPACAGSSDVLRGLVSGLPVGPGGGDEICLANGLPPTTLTWTDGDNPSPGSLGPWGYEVMNGVATEEVSTTCP